MKLERKERVIIVGCGRLGRRLATMLSDKGYQVIVIDNDETAFSKLPETFGGFTIKADGIDVDTLKYADIDEASMLVACTGNDNLNSLIAQIASRILLCQMYMSALRILIRNSLSKALTYMVSILSN